MDGEYMPPTARGCLTVGRTGVLGTLCHLIKEQLYGKLFTDREYIEELRSEGLV